MGLVSQQEVCHTAKGSNPRDHPKENSLFYPVGPACAGREPRAQIDKEAFWVEEEGRITHSQNKQTVEIFNQGFGWLGIK